MSDDVCGSCASSRPLTGRFCPHCGAAADGPAVAGSPSIPAQNHAQQPVAEVLTATAANTIHIVESAPPQPVRDATSVAPPPAARAVNGAFGVELPDQRAQMHLSEATMPASHGGAPVVARVAGARDVVQMWAGKFDLTDEDLARTARMVAVAFGAAAAALTVIVAVLATMLGPDDFTGGPAEWLRGGVWLTLLALGGTLTVAADASTDAGMFGETSAQARVTLRAMPLLITAAVLGGIALLSAQSERVSGSTGRRQLLARASATGVIGGALAAVAAKITQTSNLFGGELTDAFEGSGEAAVAVGVGSLRSLLITAVLLGAAALAGRVLTSPSRLGWPQRWDAWQLPARLVTTQLVIIGVVTAAAVALAAVAGVAHDDIALRDSILGLLTLPNLAVVAVLGLLAAPIKLVSDGSFGASAIAEFGDAADSGTVGGSLLGAGWWTLLLIVPVMLTVAAALRHRLSRPVDEPVVLSGQLIGRGAAVGAAASMVLAWLGTVSASAALDGDVAIFDLDGTGTVRGGVSLGAAVMTGAVWGALVMLALRIATSLTVTVPAVARLVGRGTAHPSWRPVLAGEAPAPVAPSRALRRLLRGAAAAAVLAVFVIGGAWASNLWLGSPERPAAAFGQALVDGNVSAALAKMQTPSNGPLLKDEALRADGITLPSDVRVGKIESGDGTATVQLLFTLAGEQRAMNVSLVESGARFGFLRQWKVSSQLPVVQFPEAMPVQVEMAGQRVGSGMSLTVVPGRYEVVGLGGPVTTNGTTVVATDGVRTVNLSFALTNQARELAQRAIGERIEQCAKPASLPLSNCPFLSGNSGGYGGYGGQDLIGATWKITKMPEYGVQLDPNGVIQTVTYETGTLEYAGTQRGWFGSTYEVNDTLKFNVDGRVNVNGSSATVVFDQ